MVVGKLLPTIRPLIRRVLCDAEGRREVFLFSCFVIMGTVEVLFGMNHGRLTFLADSVNLFWLGLVSLSWILAFMGRNLPWNPQFSYGWERVHSISLFSSSVVIASASFGVTSVCILCLISSGTCPQPSSCYSLVFSLTSLGLSILSLRSFEWRNLISSLLFVASTALSKWFAKSSCYFELFVSLLIISLLTWRTIVPSLLRESYVLLNTTPSSIRGNIEKALKEVSTLENVLSVHDEHFWTLSDGKYVGSIRIRLHDRSSASSISPSSSAGKQGGVSDGMPLSHAQRVLVDVQQIFAPYLSELFVQVERSNWNVVAMTSPTLSRDPSVSLSSGGSIGGLRPFAARTFQGDLVPMRDTRSEDVLSYIPSHDEDHNEDRSGDHDEDEGAGEFRFGESV
eukprot:TRINITY_DN80260_c0_g1_i1.p1 TRINITY_DN80260_c0_g1~~TRINITY_DN80260_c0_g1_i1.p1  ORF type:complete len:397 (+),score=97.86 TRINITY_DN80260_c0_g1_i1:156-1346(+)